MEFKRWHSIENSYRETNITWWLNRYPALAEETFVATEKADGSNVQIAIDENGHVQLGSRRQYVGNNPFGAGYALRQVVNAASCVVEFGGHRIRIYGEVYGSGIRSGVVYHPGKHFIGFGLSIDDELVSWKITMETLQRAGIPTVPVVGIGTLQEMLALDTAFETNLGPHTGNNLCEGIVISPTDKVYTTSQDSVFTLKKKNALFSEQPKPRKPVDATVKYFHDEFEKYINANRVHAVMSKTATPTIKEMGVYIREVIADARGEFVVDFDLSELSKQQLKGVFNAGKKTATLIKEILGENNATR